MDTTEFSEEEFLEDFKSNADAMNALFDSAFDLAVEGVHPEA